MLLLLEVTPIHILTWHTTRANFTELTAGERASLCTYINWWWSWRNQKTDTRRLFILLINLFWIVEHSNTLDLRMGPGRQTFFQGTDLIWHRSSRCQLKATNQALRPAATSEDRPVKSIGWLRSAGSRVSLWPVSCFKVTFSAYWILKYLQWMV